MRLLPTQLYRFISKATNFFILFGLVLFFLSSFILRGLPEPKDILPQLYSWPVQEKIRENRFVARTPSGRQYDVRLMYSYDIYGLVVALHHSNSWLDISHKDWGDDFNLADVSLVYGSMLKDGTYLRLKYSHGDWTGYVRAPLDISFNTAEFSNNHLLSEKPNIRRKILSIRVGDQIHIKGYLCAYKTEKWRNWRKTSISRNDKKCEVIYVKDLEILRHAHPVWYKIRTVAIIVMAASLLMKLVMWVIVPLEVML